MKLIHVYGDDEYSTLDFDRLNISYEKAYQKAKQCEDDIWEFQMGCFVHALDFAYDHVTDEFISFVKETIGDYDMLKHEDFYIVEN